MHRLRHWPLLLSAIFVVGLAGCTGFYEIFNSDVLGLFESGQSVSDLPGDAPGILVAVENRTTHTMRAVISYRDGDDNVRSYTTIIGAGDHTAQMLVCPIEEITIGSVTDLTTAGAVIYLSDPTDTTTSYDDLPYVEVDAFGFLLQNDVNYACGDGLTFSVRADSTARSGYRTRVEIASAE